MVSKKFTMNSEEWHKWGMNLLMFVAPTLAIFFGLLAQGQSWKLAAPVALLAFYQALADLFRKFSAGK